MDQAPVKGVRFGHVSIVAAVGNILELQSWSG
jgi:hypothetical protein